MHPPSNPMAQQQDQQSLSERAIDDSKIYACTFLHRNLLIATFWFVLNMTSGMDFRNETFSWSTNCAINYHGRHSSTACWTYGVYSPIIQHPCFGTPHIPYVFLGSDSFGPKSPNAGWIPGGHPIKYVFQYFTSFQKTIKVTNFSLEQDIDKGTGNCVLRWQQSRWYLCSWNHPHGNQRRRRLLLKQTIFIKSSP
jgi:hypothetical protein